MQAGSMFRLSFYKVYTLRSPAPILELTEPEDSVPAQLASETEAMMGQVQARWGSNDAGFARRLAAGSGFKHSQRGH
jgi:hypothetical protein